MNEHEKIFVTGASGFVGTSFCKEAIARGFYVIGTFRHKKPSFEHTHMAWIKVDDLATYPIDQMPYLKNCSALFHLSARAHQPTSDEKKEFVLYEKDNVLTTRNLLKAAIFYKVPRFIYLSSVKASTEETKSPLSICDQDAPEDAYGITKKKAEEEIKKLLSDNHEVSYTILRSPLVYGPFVKANFYKLIKLVDSAIPLPFAKSKNKRSYVYIDNLIDAIFTAAFHEKAKNKSYYVTDEKNLSIEELSSLMARSLNKKKMFFHLPLFLMKWGCKIIGMKGFFRKVFSSLEITNASIEKDLGWKPIKSTETAMQETIEWYKKGA